jgi:hypothetical protein
MVCCLGWWGYLVLGHPKVSHMTILKIAIKTQEDSVVLLEKRRVEVAIGWFPV